MMYLYDNDLMFGDVLPSETYDLLTLLQPTLPFGLLVMYKRLGPANSTLLAYCKRLGTIGP